MIITFYLCSAKLKTMIRLQDVATIQTGVFAKNTPNPNALYLQQSDFDNTGVLYIPQPMIAIDNPKHLLNTGDLLLASKGNNNILWIIMVFSAI